MNNNSSVYEGYCQAVNTDLKGRSDVASTRLLERFQKKLNPGQSKTQADIACIGKFLEDIERVSTFNLDGMTDANISDMSYYIRRVLEQGTIAISDRFGFETWPQSTFLPESLSHEFFMSFGHGKSATGEATHIIDKICRDEISYTNSIKGFLPFLNAYHPPLYNSVAEMLRDNKGKVEGSRTSTVAKNETTSRLIGMEPSINLWFQLAIGKYLELCLASAGLNIKNQQTKNILMAQQGSLEINQGDENLCTIDLQSASDSISIDLVKKVFPREWVDLFLNTRSSHTLLPGSDSYIELPMISTMGNGFTFPLLTLVCSAIVFAAQCEFHNMNIRYLDWKVNAIYGDDVIIKKKYFDLTCDVFHRAGFIVNHNKSYSIGLFRESCGGDFFNGVLITPVYVKDLKTQEDILIALNQVLDWSSKHFNLSNTLQYLYALLDKQHRNLVPTCFADSAGIKYPTTERKRSVVYLEMVKVPKKLRITSLLLLFCYLSHSAINGYYMPRGIKVTWQIRKIYWPFSWDSKKVTSEVDNIFHRNDSWEDLVFSREQLRGHQKRRVCIIDGLMTV